MNILTVIFSVLALFSTNANNAECPVILNWGSYGGRSLDGEFYSEQCEVMNWESADLTLFEDGSFVLDFQEYTIFLPVVQNSTPATITANNDSGLDFACDIDPVAGDGYMTLHCEKIEGEEWEYTPGGYIVLDQNGAGCLPFGSCNN